MVYLFHKKERMLLLIINSSLILANRSTRVSEKTQNYKKVVKVDYKKR